MTRFERQAQSDSENQMVYKTSLLPVHVSPLYLNSVNKAERMKDANAAITLLEK